jgi:ribose transport system substrate-binding protein
MARDHHDNSNNDAHHVSRRHTLEYMTWGGAGILATVASSRLNSVQAAAAIAQASPTISIIVKDKTSFYWRTVLAGARKAGRDLGVNIVELGVQSEIDAGGQIALLEGAIASNPTAIVIAPAQVAALGKLIDMAGQKVKIISIDSEVDSRAVISSLKTDHAQAGRIAADLLARAIQRTYADAEGDVAIITSSPVVPAFDQRVHGFKEQIAAKYGALEIVAHSAADGRPSAAFEVMTDLINAHPALRGVLASNLLISQGAAQALIENNMMNKTGDKINLVGFDWNEDAIKLLQQGTIAALVLQDPFRMGYDGIKTALAASKGAAVPVQIDTGANPLTNANVNSARSQQLLHPEL